MPKQLRHVNGTRHANRENSKTVAWGLRLQGYTLRQVADRLAVGLGTAAKYLNETLEELRAASLESGDSWRQIQLDRLDSVIAAWLPVACDPTHPEGARGAAVVVRACETQAKLLGLLQSNVVPMMPEKPTVSLEDSLAKSPALREAMERNLTRAKKGHEGEVVV
ncbi:MAG: hypothetical protein WC378_01275 [Opitutaceae bacterium]|jgi:hypothetical protein